MSVHYEFVGQIIAGPLDVYVTLAYFDAFLPGVVAVCEGVAHRFCINRPSALPVKMSASRAAAAAPPVCSCMRCAAADGSGVRGGVRSVQASSASAPRRQASRRSASGWRCRTGSTTCRACSRRSSTRWCRARGCRTGPWCGSPSASTTPSTTAGAFPPLASDRHPARLAPPCATSRVHSQAWRCQLLSALLTVKTGVEHSLAGTQLLVLAALSTFGTQVQTTRAVWRAGLVKMYSIGTVLSGTSRASQDGEVQHS